MARYIDADEFYVSQIARCWSEPFIGTCTTDNVKLYDEIQKFPTADAVKVVHCKDCKHARHWYGNDTFGNTAYLCDYFIDGEEIKMFPDDFCSRGEVMDATEDDGIKIYDHKTQHINADLADRCNHGTRE